MSGFAPPPPPPPACVIRGSDDIVAVVSSAESGGVSLARVGGFAQWEMLGLSGDSETGRAHVRWSSGTPGLLLDGWVDSKELSFRAKHDLPLVAGYVWINVGAELKVKPEGSSAQVSPLETAFENIGTTVKCDDLRIGSGEIEPVVGAPSYWTSSQKTLALYSGPKGKLVTALTYKGSFGATPYAALDAKDGFLHLVHYEGVHLDAWVKEIDMKPWLGELPQFPFVCGLGSIDFYDKKTVVRTLAEDTDVFLDASPNATRVGTIERGARVRVGHAKKSFVEISDEHNRWMGPPDKKLWVRASTLSP
ncbi:MAG: hypothetical protein ACXWUG_21705 [Polyangiales bacterium]